MIVIYGKKPAYDFDGKIIERIYRKQGEKLLRTVANRRIMKCRSCGAEIGLTDETCPYCGRSITETVGHQRDLKTYKSKNEKTKRRLSDTIKENMPITISAVVMVVLIIATGVAFYVETNAYRFRSDAMRKESLNKSDEYSDEIQKYLDAGDYTGFVAFKEYHEIPEWEEPYENLRLLWEITEEYADLVSSVESSLMFGQDAARYRPETDVSNCKSAIHDFYHEYEYKLSEIEADPYSKYIHDMKKKADIILRVYLGLDDTAREEFLAASDIEQEAYLEGVIIDE